MKITYHESGGFAGLVKGTEIDTTLLNPAEAQEVSLLVQQSGISGRSEAVSSDARDMLLYDISIESDAGVKELRVDSGNVSQQIKPLLKYLKQRAQPYDLAHGLPIE